MGYIDAPDPAAFLGLARDLGIATVIIAWQEEYGQHQDPAAVRYERLAQLILLGYDRAGGRILRCALAGGAAERARLRAELTAAGLTVEERSRNIIGFDQNG